MLLEASPSAHVLAGIPDRSGLQDSLYFQMLRIYEITAQETLDDFGDNHPFNLRATWKQRELMKRARIMAVAITHTIRTRLTMMDELFPENHDLRRVEFLQYKSTQLQDLMVAEAQFQAHVDILVHSGLVDPTKARIMWWQIFGDDPPRSPCPVCTSLEEANPYTVQEAASLGPKAHPNCIDEWDEAWVIDPALMANTRRQVQDREVTLWHGESATPIKGTAVGRQKSIQRVRGGWAGVKTEQRRLIRARSGTHGT